MIGGQVSKGNDNPPFCSLPSTSFRKVPADEIDIAARRFHGDQRRGQIEGARTRDVGKRIF